MVLLIIPKLCPLFPLRGKNGVLVMSNGFHPLTLTKGRLAVLWNPTILIIPTMGKVVLNIRKDPGVGGHLTNHIERSQTITHEDGTTERIRFVPTSVRDESRMALNRTLIGGDTPRSELVSNRIKECGVKVRADQVRSHIVVMSGTHEDMKKIEKDGKLDEWCNDCIELAKRMYGDKNVVQAVLHMDEKTPHIHFTCVPLVQGETLHQWKKAKAQETAETQETPKKGGRRAKSTTEWRLCGKEVFTPKKGAMWRDWAGERMAKYGLDRGEVIMHDKKKPLTTSEWIEDRLDHINSLEPKTKEQEATIEKQEAKIEEQEATIEKQEAKIEDLDKTISDKQDAIRKANSELSQAEHKKNEAEAKRDKAEADEYDSSQKVVELKAEIKQLKNEREKLHNVVDPKEQGLFARAKSAMETIKEKGLSALNASDKDALIESLIIQRDKAEAEANSLKDQFPLAVNKETATLNNQVRSLENQVSKLKHDVSNEKSGAEYWKSAYNAVAKEKKSLEEVNTDLVGMMAPLPKLLFSFGFKFKQVVDMFVNKTATILNAQQKIAFGGHIYTAKGGESANYKGKDDKGEVLINDKNLIDVVKEQRQAEERERQAQQERERQAEERRQRQETQQSQTQRRGRGIGH